MITELKREEFYKINHLLDVETCNLEIKSVVHLNNPGWIFVDNTDYPKTAVVWSKGIRGFYLIGDENNSKFNQALSIYFDDTLIPRAKELGYNRIEISGTSDIWNERMESVFGERQQFDKSYQYVYTYDDIKRFDLLQPKMESSAVVKKVNRELLENNYNNLAFLEGNILAWWDSIDAFLEKGIGYCIVFDNKIVTSCVTSFMGSDAMESHIETVEEYRKKGFARRAVYAFLMACKEKNISTYWDCMATNVGSYTIAEGLGYKRKFTYALYTFNI